MVSSARRAGPPWVGVALVAASKAADAVTTFLGLAGEPAVREANPLVAAAAAAVGVPGALVALGALSVVAIAAATEAGAAAASATTVDYGPTAVRVTGYGLATGANVAIAVHNATVLAAA